jgi:DNA-binding IclR family transcriptional regulator
MSEVETARIRRYSIDYGNYISGITLIAAPVFDVKNRMSHSLTVAGVADQMDANLVRTIAKELLREADELTRMSAS